ncbi:MAG: hypothetical protein JRN20_02345 [Nitrososphaerota archaeon]|nr:hypothetical protein [Nitrososphaerota archaeon]MDG6924194.1 hypothetical protein [Nitrososphaerota archaeon]
MNKVTETTTLEELSMNAWPSLQTIIYDGWILRFSEGYTKRANSVNPIYPGGSDVNEKIDKCESFYFGKGMDTVFKMTNASYPQGLDRILASRGYQYQTETSVQISRLKYDEGSLMPSEQTVALTEDVSDGWLSSFCEMNGISGTKQQVARQMLVNTVPAKRLASVSNDNGKTFYAVIAVIIAGTVLAIRRRRRKRLK